MTERALPGGCLCGAVRYAIAGIVDAGFCHCASCRRATGAACPVWALAPAQGLAIERGAPARFPVEGAARRFCAACGSPLWTERGDRVEVAVGTLDDPEAVPPRVHRCIAEAPRWLRLYDLLPWADGRELPAEAERSYLLGPAEPSVARGAPVTLREVTSANLRHALLLRPTGPQQRFVALNANSLAEAQFRDTAWPRLIYAGEVAVGFAQLNVESEDYEGLPLTGDPYLWRFMIGEHYQGMGFGAQALALVIEEVAAWGTPKALWTSCIKGAGSPYEFYLRHGFTDTGVQEDDEWLLRRPL